ncbi:MAG: hypothetical protein ACFFFC_11975 [Candidatus Thorarchaeota archaeon]
MSCFDIDNDSTHPLWFKLGVEFSSTLSGEPSMYIWDVSHDIFTEPNDRNAVNFTSNVFVSDDADTLTVLSGYTALAGSTADAQDGNALTIVSNDKQTLYNGYLIDTCTGDEDDSTYRDSVELWQNEIVFTTIPGGGLPFNLDLTKLLIIGGSALALILILVLVSRRRSGGSTPKKQPKKKPAKKKK